MLPASFAPMILKLIMPKIMDQFMEIFKLDKVLKYVEQPNELDIQMENVEKKCTDIDKGARIRGNLEITGSIPTVKTRRIESDGITNIITVDADGTAAHLTFNVDGDIICKPISSHLYIRSGSVDTCLLYTSDAADE